MSSSWISSLKAIKRAQSGICCGIGRRVAGEPLERDDRAVVRHRQDDVRLHLPHVDVEHDVREDPSVNSLWDVGLARIVFAIGCSTDDGPQRSVLDG